MVQGRQIATRESGFATVAVIGVCAALATVAAVLLQFTQAQRDRVAEEIARESQEQVVRSAIALEVAQLAEAPRHLPDTLSRIIGPWTVELHVTNEQAKTNVLSAEADLIASALMRLGIDGPPGLAERIVDLRDTQSSVRSLPLAGVLLEAGFPEEALDCVGEVLTVYGSSIDPLATGKPQSMDGGVINLRARIVLPQPSDFVRERVFVFTGDAAQPLIELSDRRLRSSLIEGCRHEET